MAEQEQDNEEPEGDELSEEERLLAQEEEQLMEEEQEITGDDETETEEADEEVEETADTDDEPAAETESPEETGEPEETEPSSPEQETEASRDENEEEKPEEVEEEETGQNIDGKSERSGTKQDTGTPDEDRRILVVDDEPQILRIVQHVLEKEGFETQGAKDAMTAEQALLAKDFDLLLLDIMLPGKDGVEFLKELRNQDEYEDLPIVLMSARRERETIMKSIAAGTDDYVVKPFEPETLLDKVQQSLAQAKTDS